MEDTGAGQERGKGVKECKEDGLGNVHADLFLFLGRVIE